MITPKANVLVPYNTLRNHVTTERQATPSQQQQGQLAFGLAGAAIGFFLGGPTGAMIGWSLGSMAGSLLDPPKIQGPRLQDTKVRGADYGVMRPILYGMARIGGLGMGQGSTSDGPNKFTEHEEKSSGKGGPEITNYRYTLSFFNEICEGPIIGVQRRWANAKLVTEANAEASDKWPFTLYVGNATQMPDPTMETVYGAGEVNPMRGVAYEAIEEKDVTDFGNARPNVEYEAFTSAGEIPWRVTTFAPWSTGSISNYVLSTGLKVEGVIYAAEMTNGFPASMRMRQWGLDGVQIGSTVDIDTSQNSVCIVDNALLGLTYLNTGVGGIDVFWWRYVIDTQQWEMASTYFSASSAATFAERAFKSGDYVFGLGHRSTQTWLCRMNYNGGVVGEPDPMNEVEVSATHVPGDFLAMGSNDGTIYLMTGAAGACKLWHYDTDLNLLHFWDVADTAGSILHTEVLSGYVWNNILVLATDEGAIGGGVGDHRIRLVQINDDFTLETIGTDIDHDNTKSVYIGGGLMMDSVGIYSLNPPPALVILGDIVADLLERAGLTAGQYDVSDLTQEVRGFVVASQMTVRNAIDVLRKAFFFDVTEFDGKVVCVNRGHDAIDTIPDGDLAAHTPGDDSPEPLELSRVPEAELPRTVFITYYDVDADYQQGSQYWRRTVTRSQSDVTLDLPVVFSATEALLRAQWHMHFAWLERDRFTFYTTRKWSKLTPTDVVVVRGVNIRITSKTESPNGLIKFEGVRGFAGGFTDGNPVTEPIDGATPGSGGGGQPPQTAPVANVATQLILLDIPLVSSLDSPYGFYAAMGPSRDGPWPGAGLYKSLDGGVTYNAVASTSTAAVIGTASGALANYTGGAVLDTASGPITIVLTDDDATLESCTSGALTNGANLCAIKSGSGWEILQFQNATLTAAKTYEIAQPYYRGRKGTAAFNAGHTAGDTFVLLPTTNVDAPQAELNVALKYKAVTYGAAIADATAQDFTNTGLGIPGGTPPIPPVSHTAGTYTIVPSDRGKLLSFSNASGVAVTLPRAGVDFPDGWSCFVQNTGVGDVVVTPTTSTIDGAASLTLHTNQGATLSSNGTNYFTMRSITPAPAVPTGTGFRHVTSGAEDAAARAVDLGSADVTASADISANSHKITNVSNPTSAQDAATKAYVDALAVGLDPKASVRVATTANITLSGTQTIDGVAVIAGDRVLVKNQSTGADNGIYVCAAGAWARSADADSSAEVTAGMYCFSTEGTANHDIGWLLTTNDPITLGSTALTFAQFTGLSSTTTYQIEFLIGDGINPILTGPYPTGVVIAPRGGTITGWTILSCDGAAPVSGSIVIDVWKDVYANYPPNVADTITASAKPTVTTATKATSTTLTGWNTTLTAGDVLVINVDSVTSFKAVKLILTYG